MSNSMIRIVTLRHDLQSRFERLTLLPGDQERSRPNCSRGRAGWPPDDTSIIAAPTSRVPGRHVRRVRRPVSAGTKEPVVVVGVDVMSLHHPHQMHRIGAAGKAAVSVVYVVADRLGAGEPFRADPDRADAMLRL